MRRSEIHPDISFFSSLCFSLFLILLLPAKAFGDSPFLLQGISDYDKGDYASAVGHFGEAASSDFNEPILHYYMANTYVHLKQSEPAIREFRIAYALSPQGEIGRLCKLGLAHYGMDSTGIIATSAKGAALPIPGKDAPRLDPAVEQALTVFRRKIEEAKISSSQQYQNQAEAVSRRAEYETQAIQRQTQQNIDDLQNNPVYRRSPTMRQEVEQQMRDDAARRIEALNKHYELQKTLSIGTGTKSSAKIDESASNLEQLMTEKSHPGVPKLSPMGTNLYVRNYEHEQAAVNKTTTKTMPKSASTTAPSNP